MSYMRAPERQEQILECAKKVFAERGFHAANISHICAEAGIGRGTLYQYFGNKKAVFAAILRETLGRVQALMREQSLPRMPQVENLRRADVVAWSARRLREILAVVFEDDRVLRIVLREAVGLDVDIETLLAEIDDGLIGIVEASLVAAQQAGIVRPLDARIVAALMVGGVEKAALTALRSGAPVDLDALALEAARLHGLGTLSDQVRD